MTRECGSWYLPVMSGGDVLFASSLLSNSSGVEFNFVPRNEQYRRNLLAHVDRSAVTAAPQSELNNRRREQLREKYDFDITRATLFPSIVYDGEYPESVFSSGGDLTLEYAERAKKAWGVVDLFDRLFENANGGLLVQCFGGEEFRQIAHEVAVDHGVLSVWVGFSPIDNQSRLCGDQFTPAHILEPYRELSDGEIAEAMSHVEAVRSGNKRYKGHNAGDIVQKYLEKLQVYLNRDEEIGDVVRSKVKKKLLWTARARYAETQTETPESTRAALAESDCVLFPLQYQRESRVTLRAPQFYRQEFLAEYLSRSLPISGELLVKEHPEQRGSQPLLSLRDIGKFAHLVHVDAGMSELARDCRAVVALNNTAGYEALLCGTPVLSIGSSFYDEFNGVYNSGNFDSLSEGVSAVFEAEGPTDPEIVENVHAVRQCSYPGKWGDTSKVNVDRFVDSVREFAL